MTLQPGELSYNLLIIRNGIQKTGVKQTGVRETRVEQSEEGSIGSRMEKEKSSPWSPRKSGRIHSDFLLMYPVFQFITHVPCNSKTFRFFTKSRPFNAICTQTKLFDAKL